MRTFVAGLVVLLMAAPAARADHTPVPSTVTLVGSLQSELGCPNDWAPECAQTHLAPVAGSPGIFRASFDVPAGSYEYKVALNGSWDENYGAGGAPGGANLALQAPGGPVTFTYDHATHVISDDVPKKPGAEQGAHWLRRDVIAWNAPAGAVSYRLHVAPEGGLELADGQIAGESYPLTLDAGGLDAGLRDEVPPPRVLRCARRAARRSAAHPRAAHRPARGGRVRRGRQRHDRHRRAAAGRARPALRRPRGGSPARPDLAPRHAEALRLGADGEGRRAGCSATGASPCAAHATARGRSRAASRGGTRSTRTACRSTRRAPTRSSPTSSPTRTRWR